MKEKQVHFLFSVHRPIYGAAKLPLGANLGPLKFCSSLVLSLTGAQPEKHHETTVISKTEINVTNKRKE